MSASQSSRETSNHPAPHAAEPAPTPNPHTAQSQSGTQTVGPSGVHPNVARAIRELIEAHGMPHIEQAVKEAKGQGSSY